MSKVCSKCKVEKDEGEFYRNAVSADGLDYYCKECRKKRSATRNTPKVVKEYADDSRKFVESLKTNCVKCGEDRPWVIQFHHIDHSTKEFEVAQVGTRGRSAILREASKCVCLCSNCHDEFHHFFGKRPVDPLDAFDKYMNEDY